MVNNKSASLHCDAPTGACTLAVSLADHIGVDVFPPFTSLRPILYSGPSI